MKLREITAAGLNKLNIPADAAALARLEKYYMHLEERGCVMNLTAIHGESDVARLHFLDCAAILSSADFDGARVIDVGTGAGFPGLVLAALRPEMKITLLDSLDKRVNFLRETGELLELENIECVHARAEEIPEGFREAFDIATSRAVARLNTLCELCLPYVKCGGVFLAMKGPDCEAEIEEAIIAAEKLGGAFETLYRYEIPETNVAHTVAVIRKNTPTPAVYPRKWAQIKKRPL